MASMSVTLAPNSTSRIAKLLPIKPNPPVISTFLSSNCDVSNIVSFSKRAKASDQCFRHRVHLIAMKPGVHRHRQNLAADSLGHPQIAASIAEIGVCGLQMGWPCVMDQRLDPSVAQSLHHSISFGYAHDV